MSRSDVSSIKKRCYSHLEQPRNGKTRDETKKDLRTKTSKKGTRAFCFLLISSKQFIKFSQCFFKIVKDLLKDHEKLDCTAPTCSSSSQPEADEIDNIECNVLSIQSSLKSIDTAEKSTNTNIIRKKPKRTQTTKVQTRTIATQTYLNINSSLFEKSSIIKYDKEVQTKAEQEIAVQTEMDQSQIQINDCTSNSDTESEKYNTSDECDQNSSGEDFELPAESSINSEAKLSDSESEADSEAEDDLIEQENIKYILSNDKPASEQIKIVVFEAAIVNAFTQCLQCGALCNISLEQQIGSTCSIHISCSYTTSHDFTWSTGPMINRLPTFHLLFAAGILSTGLESSKVIRLFDALKIINIKQRGLSNILKSYVIPAVFQIWDREQKSNIATIKGKPVTIASDMRVDSPGHSGLLGSGSTLDLESKLVLDTQVIRVNIGL